MSGGGVEGGKASFMGSNWPLERILDSLFVLCVIGVTFKQLRFAGVASLFDGLLVVLACYFLATNLSWSRRPDRLIVGAILLITVPTAVAVVLSLPNGLSPSFLREVAAYCVSLVVVAGFFLRFGGRLAEFIDLFVLILTIYLVSAIAVAFLPNPLQDAMWYYGVKFQALSDNPNQIAFLSVLGLSFILGRVASRRQMEFIDITQCLTLAVAGALNQSGALVIAIVAVFGLILGLSLIRIPLSAMSRGGQTSRPNINAGLLGILALIVVVAAIPIAQPLIGSADPAIATAEPSSSQQQVSSGQGIGQGIALLAEADSGQGTMRLALWSVALSMARESPIFGLGPGPHINLGGDLPLMEAHNTYLDVLLISGLFGLCSFLVLLSLVAVNGILRNRFLVVVVMAFPVLVFIGFHFVGRQPAFWIWLFVLAAVSASNPWKSAGDETHQNGRLKTAGVRP